VISPTRHALVTRVRAPRIHPLLVSRKVRWTLTRGDGELVGSGVRFRASEPDEAIVARARRDASGQARSGDRLSVFIDGALFLEEPVALDERRAG
jgi:hypothetical protein